MFKIDLEESKVRMEQERKDMAEVIKKDFAKQIDNLNKENENLTDKINNLSIKHRNEIITDIKEIFRDVYFS